MTLPSSPGVAPLLKPRRWQIGAEFKRPAIFQTCFLLKYETAGGYKWRLNEAGKVPSVQDQPGVYRVRSCLQTKQNNYNKNRPERDGDGRLRDNKINNEDDDDGRCPMFHDRKPR